MHAPLVAWLQRVVEALVGVVERLGLARKYIARDLLAREAPLPMKLPDGVAVP